MNGVSIRPSRKKIKRKIQGFYRGEAAAASKREFFVFWSMWSG